MVMPGAMAQADGAIINQIWQQAVVGVDLAGNARAENFGYVEGVEPEQREPF